MTLTKDQILREVAAGTLRLYRPAYVSSGSRGQGRVTRFFPVGRPLAEGPNRATRRRRRAVARKTRRVKSESPGSPRVRTLVYLGPPLPPNTPGGSSGGRRRDS